MTYLAFVIGSIILISILLICIYSPGKLAPLKDAHGKKIPGSFSEKTWVTVNGIPQGMFIRGENRNNPVVLYLHGGPGTPMLQFIEYLDKGVHLEKYFTICYWDQRGSGMTYDKTIDPSTLTVTQMVEDTRVVTEYLKTRFQQDKIYLLGHSWGSYLGVKTIQKYPNNYLAYIGVGQVTEQTESERLAYSYMMTHAKEIQDQEVIKKLEKYNPNDTDFPKLEYLLKVRTSILNRYKIGHLHQGLSFSDIPKSLFVFKGYTIKEKIKWFQGADFSMLHLFPVVLQDSLFQASTKFEIPFYILQGDYDYQVSQVLARKYLDVLEAPKKAYFHFTNSAHSPNMEEVDKFVTIFRNIALDTQHKK